MFSFPRKSYFQPPVLGKTIPRETASPPGAQQDIFFSYFSPGNPMGRKELCSSMKVHGRTGHYLRNRRARLRRGRQKSAGKENERDFFDLVKRNAPKRWTKQESCFLSLGFICWIFSLSLSLSLFSFFLKLLIKTFRQLAGRRNADESAAFPIHVFDLHWGLFRTSIGNLITFSREVAPWRDVKRYNHAFIRERLKLFSKTSQIWRCI